MAFVALWVALENLTTPDSHHVYCLSDAFSVNFGVVFVSQPSAPPMTVVLVLCSGTSQKGQDQ